MTDLKESIKRLSTFAKACRAVGDDQKADDLFSVLSLVATQAEELEKLQTERVTTYDRISDVLYGGECGWEQVKHEDFKVHIAKAIKKGAKYESLLRQVKGAEVKWYNPIVEDILIGELDPDAVHNPEEWIRVSLVPLEEGDIKCNLKI